MAISLQAAKEAARQTAAAGAIVHQHLREKALGITYFTWSGVKKSSREYRKFTSTSKNLAWVGALARCEVDGETHFRSTKGRIGTSAYDLLSGHAGFAVHGKALWKGPVEKIHRQVEAYLAVHGTAVEAAMQTLGQTDWTLAEALLRHTPEFTSELVKAPEVVNSAISGTSSNYTVGFGGRSYHRVTTYYVGWSAEVRRFAVRVGEHEFSYLATAKTRDCTVTVDASYTITDAVRAKLEATPTKSTDEVNWTAEGTPVYSGHHWSSPTKEAKDQLETYTKVVELIELTRTAQTAQVEPVTFSTSHEVVMLDYGGEIRQSGATERHAKWVISANGESRKPDCGDPTSYAGEVWWDEIHRPDLVLEWSKAFTADDHHFRVAYLPPTLTEAQVAAVKAVENALREEWDGATAAFSDNRSPPVGEGWGLLPKEPPPPEPVVTPVAEGGGRVSADALAALKSRFGGK